MWAYKDLICLPFVAMDTADVDEDVAAIILPRAVANDTQGLVDGLNAFDNACALICQNTKQISKCAVVFILVL
jgi:hypothetical protein